MAEYLYTIAISRPAPLSTYELHYRDPNRRAKRFNRGISNRTATNNWAKPTEASLTHRSNNTHSHTVAGLLNHTNTSHNSTNTGSNSALNSPRNITSNRTAAKLNSNKPLVLIPSGLGGGLYRSTQPQYRTNRRPHEFIQDIIPSSRSNNGLNGIYYPPVLVINRKHTAAVGRGSLEYKYIDNQQQTIAEQQLQQLELESKLNQRAPSTVRLPKIPHRPIELY